MNEIKEKALARLRELRAEADAIDYSSEGTEKFKEWKFGVEAALRKLFGDDSTYLKEFRENHWSPWVVTQNTTDNEWEDAFLRGLARARAIISSAIREVEDYDILSSPSVTPNISVATPGVRMARKAFVVHGHDSEMKEAVARFLQKFD